MEVSKKRSGDSVKSASPKKQRTSNKKGQSGKGKKDPNKPKRPKTAYLHFMDDFRARRKNDVKNGEEKSTKIGDVAKDGGAAWGKMSTEEKQPYANKYQKEKDEYDRKVKLLKPAKDQNKPKRPMTSFLYFLEEYRGIKKEQGMTGPDVSKSAGEKWRAMSDNDKQKYMDLQAKAKTKFEENMKEYLAKNPAPSPQKKVKVSKAKVQEESESEDEDEEEEEEDDDEEEEEEDDEEEESD